MKWDYSEWFIWKNPGTISIWSETFWVSWAGAGTICWKPRLWRCHWPRQGTCASTRSASRWLGPRRYAYEGRCGCSLPRQDEQLFQVKSPGLRVEQIVVEEVVIENEHQSLADFNGKTITIVHLFNCWVNFILFTSSLWARRCSEIFSLSFKLAMKQI